VHELAVLEESLQKAEESVPEGFGVHRSQADDDDGSYDTIPKWRMEQIRKMKAFDADGIEEEIEDLRDQGETSIAERKAKRVAEKKRTKDAGLKKAMALISGDDSVMQFGVGGASKGGMTRQLSTQGVGRERTAGFAGNVRHTSIMMGKMNPRQYATLDGEFHLDSHMGADDGVAE
jgi:hypothetical protein